MKKETLNFFFLAAAVAVLIAFLRFLNWLPSSLEEGLPRKYASIEEIRTKLHIKEIYVPSYFPRTLLWPPYEVIAQTKPFTSVIMKFKSIDTTPAALVISQSEAAVSARDVFPPMAQVTERVVYPLKGRQALLEVGTCGGRPCSRISWTEGRYKMAVAAILPPIDLIRISESMLR